MFKKVKPKPKLLKMKGSIYIYIYIYIYIEYHCQGSNTFIASLQKAKIQCFYYKFTTLAYIDPDNLSLNR